MLHSRTQPSLNRDFTMLSLFIVIILLLVSAWVTVETLNNYADDVRKRLENDALRVDRALIVETENASYILESLGRQIQATGLQDQDAVAQLFFSFAKSEGPKRSIFSWIDKNQQLIISSNLGVLEKPIDVSDRDYVKKSIAEPWKVHIGRPILGRLSKKMVLPLSLGLTDDNGTYAGSVIVAVDIASLTDDLGRVIKDSGTRFAISNLAGTLITQTQASERFFTQTFDSGMLSKLDFAKVTSGEYSKGSLWHGEKVFAYYERSSQYPFVIFLGYDPSISMDSIRDMLLPRIFQLCIIAIFLLFVLWVVRRRIIQPVIHLTQQSASIVRGERFEPNMRLGPMEIEQLAHEIKRLYDYIEERRRVESELRLKNAELTRIKEAAQVTNQVKAEFFAYVGQELTDPVTLILDRIKSLRESAVDQATANDIHRQAQHVLEMLADIKAISEAETGLLALTESEIDLNFILQKTIRIFRERSGSGVDVHLDVNTNLPRVRGDELRLKQMVLHILGASARHLLPGDPIRITSSLKQHELSLCFAYMSTQDMGSGANAMPRSKHGLELALARLLIAMHQGTLEIKTMQDRTTMVTVKFPPIRVI